MGQRDEQRYLDVIASTPQSGLHVHTDSRELSLETVVSSVTQFSDWTSNDGVITGNV